MHRRLGEGARADRWGQRSSRSDVGTIPQSGCPKCMRSLAARVTLHSVIFFSVVAFVLFGAAGTCDFWQAWVFLSLAFGVTNAINIYLLRNDVALLERRLTLDERGEKEGVQKIIIALMRLFALATFVVAGLDRRFRWSTVPPLVVVVGCVAYVAASVFVFFVFRENSYASSTIDVHQGQMVVATGPYRWARHPMYAGVLLIALATPLALGSYWAATSFFPLGALIIVRLCKEEQ